MIRDAVRRGLLLSGAALGFVVVAIVAVEVIPSVRTDTYPLATPESAAASFWVVGVGINTLVGVILLAAAHLTRRDRGGGRGLAVLAGLVAVVVSLLLLDAAVAFAEHGPSMRWVTIALYMCLGCDLTAGALALIAAVLPDRRRQPGAAESTGAP